VDDSKDEDFEEEKAIFLYAIECYNGWAPAQNASHKGEFLSAKSSAQSSSGKIKPSYSRISHCCSFCNITCPWKCLN